METTIKTSLAMTVANHQVSAKDTGRFFVSPVFMPNFVLAVTTIYTRSHMSVCRDLSGGRPRCGGSRSL